MIRILDGCIICGLCEVLAPRVFRVDDDGAVVVAQPDHMTVGLAVAIVACPVSIIVIEPDPVVD